MITTGATSGQGSKSLVQRELALYRSFQNSLYPVGTAEQESPWCQEINRKSLFPTERGFVYV